MRPRVFPAEDTRGGAQGRHPAPRASMRPRVFPAEDFGIRVLSGLEHAASMRPRVFPAEDPLMCFHIGWSGQLQ